jgi:hypothetical protein
VLVWLSPEQCPSREVPTEVDADGDGELDVPEAGPIMLITESIIPERRPIPRSHPSHPKHRDTEKERARPPREIPAFERPCKRSKLPSHRKKQWYTPRKANKISNRKNIIQKKF